MHTLRFLFILIFYVLCTFPGSAQESFPTGEIKGPFQWTSDIYPGTVRDYWIYVPQQYDADRPTCSIIVQDGLRRAEGWNLPRVMDSLIAGEVIPVMIGIFVDHGKVPSASPEEDFPRYNRSFEYDALGDRYARFLLEELLPELGKDYNLSTQAGDRCIAGASSGAICAFNAAWERPDAFSRVLSTIGTYVGLRGGDEFPTLVRKTEPKPLRIFLEDGSTDLNIYAGDWWVANQDMLSALRWAGYEVNHVWGQEGHNSKGAKKIMAEALAWLWADYPQAPAVHLDQYQGLDLVEEDSRWRRYLPHLSPERIAVDSNGMLYLLDLDRDIVYRIRNNQHEVLYELEGDIGAITIGADNQVYISDLDNRRILQISEEGHGSVLMDGIYADHLVGSRKGFYFASSVDHRLGFYHSERNMITSDLMDGTPTSLALSAKQTYLNVTTRESVFGQSFKIASSGALQFGQDYTHFHIPYGQALPGASGVAVDAENRTYTATNMGIQVADQLGRINYILQSPVGESDDLSFGDPDMNMLYLVSDGRLYRKTLKTKGVSPIKTPVKPPSPKM